MRQAAALSWQGRAIIACFRAIEGDVLRAGGSAASEVDGAGQPRPALIAADELLPALQFVLVRARLRRPHALFSLMEAHVARGVHNSLSQYWVRLTP